MNRGKLRKGQGGGGGGTLVEEGSEDGGEGVGRGIIYLRMALIRKGVL